MNLFEYLPKPNIYLDPYSPEQKELQFHSSILTSQKSFEEKAKQASIAFEKLFTDFESNPITQKLIICLDKEFVNLLLSEFEERNRLNRVKQHFSLLAIVRDKSNNKEGSQDSQEYKSNKESS
ncbi:unnamed protein product [Paramecium primaurelia]|uniref:Uncharacterized protein n=1 Tax=Paramecium primaurelia TaxID=5886 RepID=A0A8S1PKC4_PARPR|nr:unnamed protein product [Paramecium primaurelia]